MQRHQRCGCHAGSPNKSAGHYKQDLLEKSQKMAPATPTPKASNIDYFWKNKKTTKETWPKGDASRKLPAVTCKLTNFLQTRNGWTIHQRTGNSFVPRRQQQQNSSVSHLTSAVSPILREAQDWGLNWKFLLSGGLSYLLLRKQTNGQFPPLGLERRNLQLGQCLQARCLDPGRGTCDIQVPHPWLLNFSALTWHEKRKSNGHYSSSCARARLPICHCWGAASSVAKLLDPRAHSLLQSLSFSFHAYFTEASFSVWFFLARRGPNWNTACFPFENKLQLLSHDWCLL